jgi:hypothetical protein
MTKLSIFAFILLAVIGVCALTMPQVLIHPSLNATALTVIGGPYWGGGPNIVNVFDQDGQTNYFAIGRTGKVDIASFVTVGGYVKAGSFITDAVPFASLPQSPVLGMQQTILDSQVNTWGAAITTGGGNYQVLAWYNGTNWTVIGV